MFILKCSSTGKAQNYIITKWYCYNYRKQKNQRRYHLRTNTAKQHNCWTRSEELLPETKLQVPANVSLWNSPEFQNPHSAVRGPGPSACWSGGGEAKAPPERPGFTPKSAWPAAEGWAQAAAGLSGFHRSIRVFCEWTEDADNIESSPGNKCTISWVITDIFFSVWFMGQLGLPAWYCFTSI